MIVAVHIGVEVSTTWLGFCIANRSERAQIPLPLISTPELRELPVGYYESLDSETRALATLRRV